MRGNIYYDNIWLQKLTPQQESKADSWQVIAIGRDGQH